MSYWFLCQTIIDVILDLFIFKYEIGWPVLSVEIHLVECFFMEGYIVGNNIT